MKRSRIVQFCLLLSLLVLLSGVVSAEVEDSLFDSQKKSKTDWEKSVVRAKGYGVAADHIKNKAQAKILAREAAITMAQRRLLEVIKGVNINSTQTVKNAQIQSDVIKKRLSGVIKGAMIVEEKQPAKGTYMVVLEVKFYGQDGIMKAILPTVKSETGSAGTGSNSSSELQVNDTSPAQDNNNTAEQSKAPTQQNLDNYTGVIINTINVNVKPAMFPKIYSANHKLVYGIDMLNTDGVITNGIVGYNRSLNAAKANPRVGSNPLVINAQGAEGDTKADLVLAAADARKLKRIGAKNNIFKNNKVIIVLN
mgnify:CR=1 FL=1